MDQLKPSVGSTFVCTRSGSAVSKRPASRVLTLKRPAASPGPVLKRPATSTEGPEPSTPKTPEPSLPKTADLVEKNIAPDHEHGEEEPKEEDPEIECDAKKGSKPEVTKKKPATLLPTSEIPAEPASERGKVVQTIDKPNGWKLVQIQTAKGRKYWKWIAQDGQYYFSRVKAEANGFQDT